MCVDPPEPDDDPIGYADFLRRKVVATARAYCRGTPTGRKFVKFQKESYPLDPIHSEGIDGWVTSFGALCRSINDLDEWKKEFKIEEID